MAIKLAADDIAPMLQVALRSGIAALLVGLLLAWQGGWREWLGSTWLAGVLAGVLFALEFFFIALGLRHTTASHMAVFLYTAPIFSALGLHLLLPSERLRRLQWLGIALCFGGVVMAFGVGGNWAGIDAGMLLGDVPVSYTHLDVYKRQPHDKAFLSGLTGLEFGVDQGSNCACYRTHQPKQVVHPRAMQADQ